MERASNNTKSSHTFSSQRYRERLEASSNYKEGSAEDEKMGNPFDQMISKAEAYKIKGNKCYKESDYISALNFYNLAIVLWY